ncbi:MAG: hypothetical protein HY289_08675 [Planctomycetes bacterium]|nr:hypothetical protein [Planctomycetota bacterium]
MLTSPHLLNLEETRIFVPWATGHNPLDDRLDCWLYHSDHSSHDHPANDGTNNEDPKLAEFILTPIQKDYWQDVWEITMKAAEIPGILARLTSLLGQEKINVILADTITCDDSRYHINRLVVDCLRYRSPIDGDFEERRTLDDASLDDLRRKLIVEFIKELHFLSRLSPSLNITRLPELWHLHHIRGRYREHRLGLCGGTVALPPKILSELPQGYAKSFGKSIHELVKPFGLVSIGGRLELMRLSIVYAGLGIVDFVVTLENHAGAIGRLASVLKEKYNLLGFRAWSSENEARSACWIVARSKAKRLLPGQQVLDKIEKLVNGHKELRSDRPAFDRSVSMLLGG